MDYVSCECTLHLGVSYIMFFFSFFAHGSVHHNSLLIKVQLDATVCSLIYFTAKSLYMFWVSQHPSSGLLKTVTAASGTGHTVKYKD